MAVDYRTLSAGDYCQEYLVSESAMGRVWLGGICGKSPENIIIDSQKYDLWWKVTYSSKTTPQENKLTNKTMTLKEKFTIAFMSEPEKSFRKAGITNGDDILTSEGREIFEAWLLKKFGSEFKAEVVDEIIKDEERK